jgi:hypothetical protein
MLSSLTGTGLQPAWFPAPMLRPPYPRCKDIYAAESHCLLAVRICLIADSR